MTLIALLVALSIERIMVLSQFWQADFYLARWLGWSDQQLAARDITGHQQKSWAVLLWVITPALGVGLLETLLDHGLVTFILSIISLLIGYQCRPARQAYRRYLKACKQGSNNTEQCQLAQQQLQQIAGIKATESRQAITWINYQYYVAITFFYLVFGVFGVLTYASLRALLSPATASHKQVFMQLPPALQGFLQQLRWAIDYIPTRLTGLGLLVVGNFSQGFSYWTRTLTRVDADNADVLEQLVQRIEEPADTTGDAPQPVIARTSLMKRQLVVWICVISILTLVGGIV